MDKNKYLVGEVGEEFPSMVARPVARPAAVPRGNPRGRLKLIPLYVLIVLSWALVGAIAYALMTAVRGSG